MRIKLHEKFDWRIPGRRAWVSFPVGEFTMTREAGETAIAMGIGEEVIAPPKHEEHVKPIKKKRK